MVGLSSSYLARHGSRSPWGLILAKNASRRMILRLNNCSRVRFDKFSCLLGAVFNPHFLGAYQVPDAEIRRHRGIFACHVVKNAGHIGVADATFASASKIGLRRTSQHFVRNILELHLRWGESHVFKKPLSEAG